MDENVSEILSTFKKKKQKPKRRIGEAACHLKKCFLILHVTRRLYCLQLIHLPFMQILLFISFSKLLFLNHFRFSFCLILLYSLLKQNNFFHTDISDACLPFDYSFCKWQERLRSFNVIFLLFNKNNLIATVLISLLSTT